MAALNEPHAAADMPADGYRPWLHRFAVLLVIATFGLIALGGTVTSQGAGLSVADWPTTFGHFMFTVPLDKWIGRGGIFWEHSHRLAGSFVGLLTIGLVAMTQLPVRRRSPRWLRWTAVGALGLVIVQGVMGGLRVTELSIELAIIHGVTGQLFLCLTVFIAAATSRYWVQCAHRPGESVRVNRTGARDKARPTKLTGLAMVVLAVLLVQLVLGALTRHLEAGLAIPDFPTAYGRIIPPLDQAGIIEATDEIVPVYDMPQPDYFTPAQVGVHFAHRVWAVVVLGVCGWLIVQVLGREPADGLPVRLTPPACALAVLLFVQVMLGISVVTSDRHTQIATAHQVIGAATLATAALLAIRIHLASPLRARAAGQQAGKLEGIGV